ncbi:hypothetical protein BHM03_00045678, partial [Ensete ventricosum]
DLRNGDGSSQRKQSCRSKNTSDPFPSSKFQVFPGCFSFFFLRRMNTDFKMVLLQTIKTNVIGTLTMLGLAKRVGARCGLKH